MHNNLWVRLTSKHPGNYMADHQGRSVRESYHIAAIFAIGIVLDKKNTSVLCHHTRYLLYLFIT